MTTLMIITDLQMMSTLSCSFSRQKCDYSESRHLLTYLLTDLHMMFSPASLVVFTSFVVSSHHHISPSTQLSRTCPTRNVFY